MTDAFTGMGSFLQCFYTLAKLGSVSGADWPVNDVRINEGKESKLILKTGSKMNNAAEIFQSETGIKKAGLLNPPFYIY